MQLLYPTTPIALALPLFLSALGSVAAAPLDFGSPAPYVNQLSIFADPASKGNDSITALSFTATAYDHNTTYESDICQSQWPTLSNGYPQSSVPCTNPNFLYHLENFTSISDFVLVVEHRNSYIDCVKNISVGDHYWYRATLTPTTLPCAPDPVTGSGTVCSLPENTPLPLVGYQAISGAFPITCGPDGQPQTS